MDHQGQPEEPAGATSLSTVPTLHLQLRECRVACCPGGLSHHHPSPCKRKTSLLFWWNVRFLLKPSMPQLSDMQINFHDLQNASLWELLVALLVHFTPGRQCSWTPEVKRLGSTSERIPLVTMMPGRLHPNLSGHRWESCPCRTPREGWATPLGSWLQHRLPSMLS